MANMEFDLTGKFLVAMPDMHDDEFEKSVVYVCSHGDEGAMGFIINQKLKDFSFSDLAVPLPKLPHTEFSEAMWLYQGGPLEKIRGFVLHSSEYNKRGTFSIDDRVSVSSSIDVLTDIASGKGPKSRLIAMGYSGWDAMQLENEILDNRWLIAPSNPDLLFHTPDEQKWERALDESHIDLMRFIPVTGSA